MTTATESTKPVEKTESEFNNEFETKRKERGLWNYGVPRSSADHILKKSEIPFIEMKLGKKFSENLSMENIKTLH